MTITGQALGSALIRDGYRTDSNGDHLRPDKIYSYEAQRYTEVLALWPVGDRKPKKLKPITRTEP